MSIPTRFLVGLSLTLASSAPAAAAASPDGGFAAAGAARSRSDGASAAPVAARLKSDAAARSHRKEARTAKHEAGPRESKRICAKPPVEVVAATESATFSLARCDGAAAPAAIDRLSTLAGARGSVRLEPNLVERLELVVDHLHKRPEPARVLLVSGYRPRSAGSYHSTGRALDFRIDGVANEAIVAFCKTLDDTGCGYYPNAGFVHMDVRDPGTGHVAWTDVSRPGEAPHYVANRTNETADSAGPALPALPAQPPDSSGSDDQSARSSEARERTENGTPARSSEARERTENGTPARSSEARERTETKSRDERTHSI
jgi:uncharacterized protein YcbK (DUF882 family)